MLKTLLTLGVLAMGMAAWGSGLLANGSNVPVTPSVRAGSAEAKAIELYNAGIAKRDRAKRLEDHARRSTGAPRAALEDQARLEFEAALADFTRAAETFPDLFQAYNGIGFAARKLGDYAKALENYDRAIEMAPGLYAEAIEYRAEAFLGLNRIDDAKQDYLLLFGADRKQADLLLEAMKAWVARRRSQPAAVDPAALAAFERWIAEREDLARVTGRMALAGLTSSW